MNSTKKIEYRLDAAWEQLFKYRELLDAPEGPASEEISEAEQDAKVLFDLLLEYYDEDKVEEKFVEILD